MSDYTDPTKVTGPKDAIKNLNVLYTEGEGGYAIAEMLWHDVPRLGIRWNGGGNVGNIPMSSGHPVWFILPKPIEGLIRGIMEVQKFKSK